MRRSAAFLLYGVSLVMTATSPASAQSNPGTVGVPPADSRNEAGEGPLLARLAAIEAVHRERASRDEADWATFAALFEPDATVEVSWFRGGGAEFVRLSRAQSEAGFQTLHHITTARALVNGDHALVRAACIITTIRPLVVGGIDVSISADTRLHYRLRWRDGSWRVVGLVAVYLKDSVVPRIPGQSIEFDRARLAQGRESYRYLTYLMAERGVAVSQDLPGIDRPESLQRVLAADEAWLAAGAPSEQ